MENLTFCTEMTSEAILSGIRISNVKHNFYHERKKDHFKINIQMKYQLTKVIKKGPSATPPLIQLY